MDLKEIINSIASLPPAEQNESQIKPNEYRSTAWRRQKGITSEKHEGYEKQRLLRAQDTEALIEHINRLTLRGLPPTKAMIRNFILGILVIALLIGGLSTVVFFFLGIPFFYFAGLFSGLLSLVPYFGAVLAVKPNLCQPILFALQPNDRIAAHGRSKLRSRSCT